MHLQDSLVTPYMDTYFDSTKSNTKTLSSFQEEGDPALLLVLRGGPTSTVPHKAFILLAPKVLLGLLCVICPG